MTYFEAKEIIDNMYNESVINDIQFINMITDISVQYESGVDDFEAYMEGIYTILDKGFKKADSASAKGKEKYEERKFRQEIQGKTTAEQKVGGVITKGTSKANKYVINPVFKGGAKVATNVYATFKKDMMTAKEKEKMANKIAGKAKGVALIISEPIPLGPIQTTLNLMAGATIANPQDEVDREFANVIKSAIGLLDKFKKFVADKALKEKDAKKYHDKAKKFESDTGKLALAMDNCTAKIARKEKSLTTESVSDDVYDIVEFVYPYVISEGVVTEKGLMVLDHLFEKGQYDVVRELILLDPVFDVE